MNHMRRLLHVLACLACKDRALVERMAAKSNVTSSTAAAAATFLLPILFSPALVSESAWRPFRFYSLVRKDFV